MTEQVQPQQLTQEERFEVFGAWERDGSAFPTYWRRREPQGDAADHIIVTGATRQPLVPGYEDLGDFLTVTCAEFGAIPDGWAAAVELMVFDDLKNEYTLLSDKDRAALAKKQATAAANDTTRRDAYGDDGSPWSRS
jgi:hypothetical protein